MIDKFDVYLAFRQAQSRFFKRPYRLPKDFDSFFKKRMSEKNQKIILKMADFLNTKWSMIEFDRYFDYGFELFGKTFSYHKFFDNKLILYYIDKDKNKKREQSLIKENFDDSVDFVSYWLKRNYNNPKISALTFYCNKTIEKVRTPIKHYQKGLIGKMFLVWLMKEGYFKPKDYEMPYIRYVMDNIREHLNDLNEFNSMLYETKDMFEKITVGEDHEERDIIQ